MCSWAPPFMVRVQTGRPSEQGSIGVAVDQAVTIHSRQDRIAKVGEGDSRGRILVLEEIADVDVA